MENQNNRNLPLLDLPRSMVPFFIAEMEEENTLWLNAYRPNYQKIIWIKKGSGQHSIDDKFIDIQNNSFHFINKGKVYQLQQNSHVDGLLIRYSNEFLPPTSMNFNDKFYSSLYGYITDVGHFQLEEFEISEYETLLGQLLREYNRPAQVFGKRNILQHLLLTLLLTLERKSRGLASQKVANTEKKDKVIYYKFLELIESNFYQNHGLEFYARELGVRRRRLTEIVKLFTNKPAKTILQERIILEAKRLLAYTNSNLKDIAYQLGFETPTYFSRIYKKYTGQTPKQYQKNIAPKK